MNNNSNASEEEKRYLRQFYNKLARFEYRGPEQASVLINEELLPYLDEFIGPPDLWHNTVTVASRLQHPRRVDIVRAGLRQWPDDVDLLCDELQFSYGLDYDPQRAQEIWSRLTQLDENLTGPFWRFWVFGAIYHARQGKVEEALALLDRGLLAVKRDGLMDVFRAYRSVLIDNAPLREINDIDELGKTHEETFAIIRERYTLGITLGVENGYVLAMELARLYQEMAAKDVFEETLDSHGMRDKFVDYLRKALTLLDLAEAMYTGNPNHPIHEIYERQAMVMMALREYDEALKRLDSISIPTLRRTEEQRIALETMRRFAILKTGGSLPSEEEKSSEDPQAQIQSAIDRALPILFGHNGAYLYGLARDNEAIRRIVLGVAAQLT